MPLKIKDGGSWKQLRRGNVPLNLGGTVVGALQLWLKGSDTWHPMFEIFASAVWGYGPYASPELNQNGYTGPQNFIDSLTTTLPSSDDGELIVYRLPDDATFAYCAFPKSLGEGLFTDEGNGFPGAWDGAMLLEDFSNFETYVEEGPLEVTYDNGNGPEQWYVYRTDFAGANYSDQTFRVDYPDRPANS